MAASAASAQTLFDSFANGTFVLAPAWGGDTAHWQVVADSDAAAGAVDSRTLRLAAPAEAGLSYLSAPVADWGIAQEWGFWVGRRGQAFTLQNQARVWLYATESALTSDTVDGYRIDIGDDTGGDEIRLQRIADGAIASTVLVSAGAIPNALTDIGLLLRVARSSSGVWTLHTSPLPMYSGEGAVASDTPDATSAHVWQGTGTDNLLVPVADGLLGLAALHTAGAAAVAACEYDQVHLTVVPAPPPLSPGDIAFVAYATDTPDGFAFLATVDIPAHTAIGFTDRGWDGTAFVGSEQTGYWCAPATTVPRGTVVAVQGGDIVRGPGVWSGEPLVGLSTSGEQVLAFQGSALAPAFLAGISTAGWITEGTPASHQSHLPTALRLGAHAIVFGVGAENGVYGNALRAGTRTAVLTAIHNQAGWLRGSEPVASPAWDFTIVDAAPALAAGAIAFVAYASDPPDRFAFVALTNLPAGTEIAFTDIGWDGASLAPPAGREEETGVWVAPAEGVEAGGVVRIQGLHVAGGGCISGALDALSPAGDQILAFQGTVTNPVFLAGVSSANWKSALPIDKTQSLLPPGLTVGDTAAGGAWIDVDNGYYSGLAMAEGAAALRALLANFSNWTRVNDDAPQAWPEPWAFLLRLPRATLFVVR